MNEEFLLYTLSSCHERSLFLCAVYDATINDGRVVLGFLVLLGFNVIFGIIASSLVAIKVRTIFF